MENSILHRPSPRGRESPKGAQNQVSREARGDDPHGGTQGGSEVPSAINDVEPGVEYAEKTMNQLIAQWRETIKPNLKRSTQESYEWAFKRIVAAFGSWPVAEIIRGDVQRFLTDAGKAGSVGSRVGPRPQGSTPRSHYSG